MKAAKRPTAVLLALAYAGWELVLKPIWTLNVERVATVRGLDVTGWKLQSISNWWSHLISYLPSSFGLGFVVGALLFAYWDAIVRVFRKNVLRVPQLSGVRVWVGSMSPFFDPNDRSNLTLVVSIVNLGVPVRITGISGNIILRYQSYGSNRRQEMELTTPSIDNPSAHSEELNFGYTAILSIKQPIPSPLQKEVFDMFGRQPFPSMRFSKLDIQLAADTETKPQRLKLWDSMRMSAGEWQVRSVETMRIYKTDEEHDAARKTLTSALAKLAAIGRDW